MILAIDIGNSYIKCAAVDRDRVLGRESIASDRGGDQTAMANTIRRVSSSVLSVDGAILSSVVPGLTAKVIRTVERQIGSRPQVVDCKLNMPFLLAVPAPAKVGADRLCAAAGAVGHKRRNAIVIDAGSAITIDIVRNGQFLGGVIAAGPSVALSGLAQSASQLPEIDFSRIATPYPRQFDTTELAMILGAGLGGAGAIREAVRYLEASTGATPRKYVTGGFAGALAPRLPASWTFDPDLTLKGLYTLASINLLAEA